MFVATVAMAVACASGTPTETGVSDPTMGTGAPEATPVTQSDVFTPASTGAATSDIGTDPTIGSTSTTVPATTSTITSTTLPTASSTTTTSTSLPTASTATATSTSSTGPPSTLLDAPSPCPPTGAEIWAVRPASQLQAPPLPDRWSTGSIGTSARGRDLTALVRAVDAPARTVLVVGGVHGNEPVSPPAVRAMVDATVPDDLELWLVPLLNPDGSAAGTRCNANGVDLNRNFSWDWRPSTGGPAPFSEPETDAVRALVERLAPDLVVWVHQPLDYVSSIGETPDAYEQAWAAGSGLPVRPDVTQHGGGESWTAFDAGTFSMLVEIASWEATGPMVDAQVDGLSALLAVVAAT